MGNDLQLRVLPEFITEFPELKNLVLNNNQLRDLPIDLRHTKLETINLSQNRFEALPTFPDSVSVLYLSKNRLKSWPESLSLLPHLRSLDISSNPLTEIPEEITGFPSLKQLVLCNNGLTRFPEGVFHIRSLQTLSLSGNQLSELPEDFISLPEVTRLEFAHNEIAEIPSTIRLSPKLKQLDLSCNALRKVPDSLSQSTGLSKLDLSHNLLTEIPPSLFTLFRLQYFILFDNQLMTLPPELSKLKSLPNLDGNPLIYLPSHFIPLMRSQTSQKKYLSCVFNLDRDLDTLHTMTDQPWVYHKSPKRLQIFVESAIVVYFQEVHSIDVTEDLFRRILVESSSN